MAATRLRQRALAGAIGVALLTLVALLVGGGAATADETSPEKAVELVLFWGDGCPHCEAERNWLEEAQEEFPQLEVTQHEVWYDEANRDLLMETADRMGFEVSGVPTTIIGDAHWVGFSDSVRAQMEAVIAEGGGVGGPAAGGASSLDVPLVGAVSLEDRSLVLSTLLIGFVDGVNPCSLWVISVLLAIVVRSGSRRRVLAIGSVFLLVTAGMYAVYMVGIYSAMSVVGHLGAIQLVIAVVAGVFGVVSVKDYFAFKRGLSFTIRDSSKPGIYHRMRAAAGQHDLLPALAATVTLAVGVSLLETPCTAGFPVLWTGLLAANDVQAVEASMLFLVYMLPFLVDELIVFGIAVVTLRATKMQERHGRLLKLVAGTTMLALAGTMLVRPETMNDPVEAALVFVAAFTVAGLTHLLVRRRAYRLRTP